ncbi:NAD-dependent epimerase/dehydratase family protein [Paenibacillus odorifer]|uniref:Epimerase n=1 Tax=Paenibacillus odorifer TaxID=189426 RepID=A0AAD0P5U4_9BACL|nr:NAD-dependent epimerase/dehydratase family protein [Paenibacillus odorifer]AWV36046.1 epimerase [Paenibacillus odorifer]
MNVFILGGAGFIGAHLTKKMCESNYNVTVYDRHITDKSLPDVEFTAIEGDFLTEDHFDNLLENQDVVIHLISTVSPYSSMLNITDSYRNDVIKTLELLEAAKRKRIKKVIFLSSGGTVYGDFNEVDLLNEDSNSHPLNHYGIMKLTIEKILLMYNQLYDMNNIILRVANPYGPGQDPEKKIGAISVFLDTILTRNTITVWGDGSTVRDYIEISDVIEAVMSAVEYIHTEHNVKPIFNVGTGIGTSIIEIIKQIEIITKVKAHVDYKGMRDIDVKRNVLDPRRAKEYLGFESKINVDQGIRKLLSERDKFLRE